MNITPIKPAAASINQRLPDVIKSWQVGQLLNARTETGGGVQSRVVLRVGQQLLEAQTPIPLKTGEQIQLSVKSLGLQPVFTILAKQNLASLAIKKLKGFIGKQGSIKNLLQQLPKFESSPALSVSIKALLRSLAQTQATPAQLSQIDSLKQFIQQSGYFHEAAINKNSSHNQQDIKSSLLKLTTQVSSELPKLPADAKISNPQLLAQVISGFAEGKVTSQQLALALTNKFSSSQMQMLISLLLQDKKLTIATNLPRDLLLLVNQLQQLSPANQSKDTLIFILRSLPVLQELQSLIETALARLSSQQLMPLAREGESPLLWLLGLPVKDKDENNLLKLRLEQQASSSNDQSGEWSVVIDFDFAEMGLIQAQANMTANSLAIKFHAEKPQSQVFIQQHLPTLELSMSKLGFNTIVLSTSSEKITEKQQLPGNIRLLDEKA